MRISGLHIYPVKSCRGITLDAATVGVTGLEHDRTWMVIDADTGIFLSQRSHPAMARIDVAFAPRRDDGSAIVLSTDAHGSITAEPTHALRPARVWDDTSLTQDAGDAVAEWLSDVLETPARLVRCGEQWQRSVTANGLTNPTTFADKYPFLVISEASLADLNTRLATPIPMARFRPNIVVTDTEAYAEDAACVLTHGDVVIHIAKACIRCTITTTDQQTGIRDKTSEPLRALAKFRRGPDGRGVVFGRNAMLAAGEGATLRVGDRFSVEFTTLASEREGSS